MVTLVLSTARLIMKVIVAVVITPLLAIVPRHVLVGMATVIVTITIATTSVICRWHVATCLLLKLIEVVSTERRNDRHLRMDLLLWQLIHKSTE